MALRIFSSQFVADHLTPPGHPERVERWHAMREAVLSCVDVCGPMVAGRLASDAELARVHTPAHLARVRDTAGKAVSLDPDTFTSPRSHDAARGAAGAALAAVEHALSEAAAPLALAIVRPPGHHAEPDRAMGFCLLNNVAVAAAHARAAGLRRVAIVDFDVHHGNGTQAAFYSDPSVLFISTHQFPFYPGTGAADEIGAAAGRGFTVNIPLAAGATDADFELAFDQVAGPVLDQFAPELLLVSAGFDSHADDPLGGMRLTTAAFGRLTARLRRAAEVHAAGRLVLVTEGGYDLRALGDSVRTVVQALTPLPPAWGPAPGSTTRAQAALERVVPILRPHWRL
jgi:acetoin utilization deacetylase AcuC-like enzyme